MKSDGLFPCRFKACCCRSEPLCVPRGAPQTRRAPHLWVHSSAVEHEITDFTVAGSILAVPYFWSSWPRPLLVSGQLRVCTSGAGAVSVGVCLSPRVREVAGSIPARPQSRTVCPFSCATRQTRTLVGNCLLGPIFNACDLAGYDSYFTRRRSRVRSSACVLFIQTAQPKKKQPRSKKQNMPQRRDARQKNYPWRDLNTQSTDL